MSRRWINSLDVEFDPDTGAILMAAASPSAFPGGSRTLATAGVAEPLVPVHTACQCVWLGARMDNTGNPINVRPVLVGDAASQNIPIVPMQMGGIVIRIDDASKVYLRAVNDGDGVAYRIFI